MSKAGWLLPTLLALAACGQDEPAAVEPAEPAAARPVNILFIMSDDHAVQAVSAYGHPISQLAPTPNIDRIAREVLEFTEGYSGNATCAPSRAMPS